MELKEGAKAPEFSLANQDEVPVVLSEIKNSYIVLYFYPKDDTPGCTLEGKEFSSLKPQFEKVDCKVLGISGQTPKSKKKFCV